MSASTFDLDELLAGVDELLEAHEGGTGDLLLVVVMHDLEVELVIARFKKGAAVLAFVSVTMVMIVSMVMFLTACYF